MAKKALQANTIAGTASTVIRGMVVIGKVRFLCADVTKASGRNYYQVYNVKILN